MFSAIKKYFWVMVGVALFVPRYVLLAQGSGTPPGPTKIDNPLKVDNLYQFVRDSLGVARDIGILVAVFFIVYSGFLFVTASGNDTKLTKAKTVLMWTVIGTAVLLGAWLFATVIEGTVNQLKA